MAFVVVYDACVLCPALLRDLLLRLAAKGLVRARWTAFESCSERRSSRPSGEHPSSERSGARTRDHAWRRSEDKWPTGMASTVTRCRVGVQAPAISWPSHATIPVAGRDVGMKTLALVVFSLLGVACSFTRELPAPAAPPAHDVPRNEDDVEAPKADETPVAIDVPHGHATVVRILERQEDSAFAWGPGGVVRASSYGERTQPICRTPCVVNLPRGPVEFRITDVENPLVSSATALNVGKKPVTLIYQPAKTELPSTGGMVTAAMLEGLGITGTVLGGLGLGLSQLPERNGAHPKDMLVPSAVTLGASVGAVLLGVVIAELSRGTYRPGAATTFVASR